MIPVAHPIRRPRNFTRDCERLGNKWLAANLTSDKFPPLWSKFQSDLAKGFQYRCGWWAMRIAEGAVDHYLSKKNHRHLTYVWSNYRYVSPCVNSSKRNKDDKVLDPFEIQPGWFEVLLPSMLIRRTALVPVVLHGKTDFTLEKLLNTDKARRYRRILYEDHRDRNLPLANLRDYAPLIAEAVTNWTNTKGLPLPKVSSQYLRIQRV